MILSAMWSRLDMISDHPADTEDITMQHLFQIFAHSTKQGWNLSFSDKQDYLEKIS